MAAHVHEHRNLFGWVLWVISTAFAFVEAHWAMVFSVLFGLVGATCHIVQTRIKIREYEDAKRERARVGLRAVPPGIERLN